MLTDKGLWLPDKLNHKGIFTLELWRGKRLIKKARAENGITTEGKNHLLDVVFHGTAAVATWYIGLIDNSGFSSLLVGDTLASHTGWTEIVPGTGYTGNRQAWVEGAASGGSITSSSTATFPMLATYTVNGAFLCSVASGSTGTLITTGSFDNTIDVVSGDNLKVNYTISY